MTTSEPSYAELVENLRREVFNDGLQGQIEALRQTLAIVQAATEENGQKLNQLLLLIRGDESLDVPGLLKRMREAERVNQCYLNDRNSIRWLTVGLAAALVGNGGLLVAILRALGQVTGGTP